ncbi:MAG TPA: MFS transporter [Polyangiaceae bacterium]|nr:MFS transporter [Polyangiaceae bacterium]
MKASLILLLLVYAAFVSLGLPDGAFGAGWPAMRVELRQPLEALGLATCLWTTCSALSSFVSAYVLVRLGTLNVVLVSGLLTACALLGFSLAPSFAWVVVLAVPLGFGAGSVDAGLNHHAAAHYSSRHMNWLHASWGVGATLGPLALSAAIAGPGGWRAGYVAIGLGQLVLVLLLFLSRGLWPAHAGQAAPISDGDAPGGAVRSSLTLWLGPASFALYAGAEGGIGMWAASVLRDSRGFSAAGAGTVVASYFAAITLGRIVSGVAADRVGNRRLVRWGLGIAGLGVAVFAWPGGTLAAISGLTLIGLGFAPIYPCLMHETAQRFDAASARLVIGRQVACAYLGGMFIAPLIGFLAGAMGLFVIAPAVGWFVLLLTATVIALDRQTPRDVLR